MQRLHDEGKIFMIAPSEPLDVGRFEGNPEVIARLYDLGFNDTMKNIENLKKYLEVK